LRDYQKLRAKLEEFRVIQSNEIDLAHIEKWMTEQLDVRRIPTGKGPGKKKGDGSEVTFNHPAFVPYNRTGNFTVHVIHKKRQQMYRLNFRKFLYPRLRDIIDWLEMEEKGER
jgi:hypothetical protein